MKDIKNFVAEWKDRIKQKIHKEDPPQLAIIQVGNNEASNRYVKNKIKDCKEVGIIAHNYIYLDSITEEDLLFEIKTIQNNYDGIIIQLPLPKHININKIIEVIDPEKDVDGFTFGSKFKPCTPGGIMEYLRWRGYDLEGKHIVIIGRSDIVGKPMAKMMTDANATVTLCHSKTKKLDDFIGMADLIICAVGKAKFLNCYAIHVPVIDVGINFDENGKLVGDCFNTENRNVSPVPGGVGLLTRCMLLENTLLAKERK